MGSLVDELQRREAVARAEAEELRGQIAQLTERLAGAEERLARLVEWLGLDSADQFDPAAFDPAQANTALAGLAAILIKD